MKNTIKQRAKRYEHAHDSPPVLDMGSYYKKSEVVKRMRYWEKSEKEIREATK